MSVRGDVREYVSVSATGELTDLERGGVRRGDDGTVTIFCHNGQPMPFVAYVHLAAGEGPRGHHYNVRRHEYLFVASGTVIGRYALPDRPDDVLALTLTTGDLVSVRPGCAHCYSSPSGAVVIEYSPEPFVHDDTITFSVAR